MVIKNFPVGLPNSRHFGTFGNQGQEIVFPENSRNNIFYLIFIDNPVIMGVIVNVNKQKSCRKGGATGVRGPGRSLSEVSNTPIYKMSMQNLSK